MGLQDNDRACADKDDPAKKHTLFLKQKALLDTFLAHGAITRAQHEKSLHDLSVKMGEAEDR